MFRACASLVQGCTYYSAFSDMGVPEGFRQSSGEAHGTRRGPQRKMRILGHMVHEVENNSAEQWFGKEACCLHAICLVEHNVKEHGAVRVLDAVCCGVLALQKKKTPAAAQSVSISGQTATVVPLKGALHNVCPPPPPRSDFMVIPHLTHSCTQQQNGAHTASWSLPTHPSLFQSKNGTTNSWDSRAKQFRLIHRIRNLLLAVSSFPSKSSNHRNAL